MPHDLHDIELDEVSLVKAGMNDGTRITIWKSARTFDETMHDHELGRDMSEAMAKLGHMHQALAHTIEGIGADAQLDADGKLEAVKAALADYATAVREHGEMIEVGKGGDGVVVNKADGERIVREAIAKLYAGESMTRGEIYDVITAGAATIRKVGELTAVAKVRFLRETAEGALLKAAYHAAPPGSGAEPEPAPTPVRKFAGQSVIERVDELAAQLVRDGDARDLVQGRAMIWKSRRDLYEEYQRECGR